MLNGWRLHGFSWFVLALILILLYLHWVPPLQQIESQPLDLAPVLSPARLIANVNDLGMFAPAVVPVVQAEAPVLTSLTPPAELGSTSSMSAEQTQPTDLSCIDEWCHGLSWWQKQPTDHWVDQVVVVSDRMKAVNYIQSQPDASLFSYFPVTKPSGILWVVVFGDFKNKMEAQSIGEVRDFGVQTKPYPKNVAAIIEDMKQSATISSSQPPQGGAVIKSSPDTTPLVPGVDEPSANSALRNPAPTE